jgi:hypothetical protein
VESQLATITIADMGSVVQRNLQAPDQEAGQFEFSAATYSVSENGGAVAILVTRAGGSIGAATVRYEIGGGTGIAGTDYILAAGLLRFANGETIKAFAVRILDDQRIEGTETLRLTLRNPTGGASLGTRSDTTVQILDYEPDQVQFGQASLRADENSGFAIVLVTRTGVPVGAITVDYATSDGTATEGTDYRATSGTLNFAADETVKAVVVPLLDNTRVEGPRTLRLTLSKPTGGVLLGTPKSTAVTILDDEQGLQGEYFNTADLTQRVLRRVDPTVDFDWGSEAPDAQIVANTFSVRWTGQLQVDVAETYTFELCADDGARLWLDGTMVVDAWNIPEACKEGTLALTRGRHDVKLEFFEDTGTASVQWRWSSPSIPLAIVPQEYLYPPNGSGAAPVLAWVGPESTATGGLQRDSAAFGTEAVSADGLDHQRGHPGTDFTYSVLYTDADGDAPRTGYPRLHILQAGTELPGSPFAMTLVSGKPTTGAIYTYTTRLPPGTAYAYYFDAKDATGVQAVASPTTTTPTVPLEAPVVSDPYIIVEQRRLRFGPVPVGETVTRSVVLRNGGTMALEIVAIGSGRAPFARAGLSLPLTLEPGDMVEVPVDFTPMAPGQVRQSLWIRSNASAEPSVRITLVGSGK